MGITIHISSEQQDRGQNNKINTYRTRGSRSHEQEQVRRPRAPLLHCLRSSNAVVLDLLGRRTYANRDEMVYAMAGMDFGAIELPSARAAPRSRARMVWRQRPYNAASTVVSSSEHGPLPSSRETTSVPSLGVRRGLSAKLASQRRLPEPRCTCPYCY